MSRNSIIRITKKREKERARKMINKYIDAHEQFVIEINQKIIDNFSAGTEIKFIF